MAHLVKQHNGFFVLMPSFLDITTCGMLGLRLAQLLYQQHCTLTSPPCTLSCTPLAVWKGHCKRYACRLRAWEWGKLYTLQSLLGVCVYNKYCMVIACVECGSLHPKNQDLVPVIHPKELDPPLLHPPNIRGVSIVWWVSSNNPGHNTSIQYMGIIKMKQSGLLSHWGLKSKYWRRR